MKYDNEKDTISQIIAELSVMLKSMPVPVQVQAMQARELLRRALILLWKEEAVEK